MQLRWSLPPQESQSIVGLLQGLTVATRTEPGCVGCWLSTNLATRLEIDYAEEWATEKDLRRRLLSDRFTTLAELMEHATEPPTIEFILQGLIRGREYAEEVRRIGA